MQEPTALAAFLASLVEAVEALTVILAVGTTRGWRDALLGCAAALLCWAVLLRRLDRR
jgi:Ca2+/H+ antiporter, TMEM165/GDT1 family